MGKITIEDISRHTGLSRGTVSRALNDRPDISEQTKQRVMEACRQLNYVPSYAARSLATGRAYAVTVVVDDLHSTLAACFLRGVLRRAQSQRYVVHVCELGANPQGAVEYLRTVTGERVDGMLLAAPLDASVTSLLAETLEAHPVVALSPVDHLTCDVLTPDYAESGRLVGRHVLRGPAADVLYVYEGGSAAVAQRLAGFREICRTHNLDPQQTTLEIAPDGPDRFAPVRQRLPGLRALAASDDLLAIALLALCYQAGRAPGSDIAVIGQGNDLAGTRVWPRLSTVDFCGEEIGRRAMDLLLQRITKSRQDSPQQTYVPPLLIARESTRSLA